MRFCCLLASLLLLLPVSSVTADEDLPPGAAAIVIFHEGNRPPRRLFFMTLDGEGLAHGFRPSLFWARDWDARQGGKRFIVMPGRYTVDVIRRITLASELAAVLPLTLNAGETVYIQLDARREAPWVAQVEADVFADYLASGGRPVGIVEDQWFRGQHLSVLGWHFGAQTIDPPVDGHCSDGPRLVDWGNASLAAELEDCGYRSGEFNWQDGTEASIEFADLRGEALRFGTLTVPRGGYATSYWLRRIPESQALDEHAFALIDANGTSHASYMSGSLRAIDGTDARGLSREETLRRLRGPLGSRVTLALSPGNTQTVNRLSVTRSGPASSIVLWPEWGRVSWPDGWRFTGDIQLSAADADGMLPPPQPNGLGEFAAPDGGRVLARSKGRMPEGMGLCIDVFGVEPCRWSDGRRLTDTGAVRRDVEEVLSLQPGLNPAMALDFLRQRQIEALLAERWTEYLQLEADLTALGVDTGIEALFFAARALETLGRHEQAWQRLTGYLNIAGQQGANYGEALSMFGRLQPEAEGATQRRITSEAAFADEARAFCELALTRGDALCACRELISLPAGECR